MKNDELTKTLSKTEKEIDELYEKLEKAQNTKNFILKQLGQFEEGVRRNDQVIGKYYYCPKNKALYHPQIYGTEFSRFGWEEDHLIYRGFLIERHNQGTCGNAYTFNTQMPIHRNFLVEDCEEISKSEFIKRTIDLINEILTLETTDTYDNEDLRQ